MPHPQILSTGSYVPERVVTNAEVDALLGKSTDQWLIDNVGIRERHWMSPEQVTSDLIVEASKKALAHAGLKAGDLDLIIVSTDTPDYLSPTHICCRPSQTRRGQGWLLRCQLCVRGLGHCIRSRCKIFDDRANDEIYPRRRRIWHESLPGFQR